ncbi:MAG: DUF2851 family protein [Croceitalea sp.]|nr:DUF2851 family protein [Croceitalea sp.]
MHEDLLHFIWKTNKLSGQALTTVNNENVLILAIGSHNQLAGPDFFNAKIEIAGQLWAGNVEIHIKSSDWFAHGHENDSNYDNVILHVVYEHDTAIFRKDNSPIPTLQLKDYIPQQLLNSYHQLLKNSSNTFINCEKDLGQVDTFLMSNWLERLYLERLEAKSEAIFELLEESVNDWEQVLFMLLLKNFGLNHNGISFLKIGQATDYKVVRKLQSNAMQLESLLLGQAGLLNDQHEHDSFYLKCKKEYDYLIHKFELTAQSVQKPEFYGLRPANFPTIRLSQIANLYAEQPNLFAKLIENSTIESLRSIFNVSASDYWTDHFVFGKKSKPSIKTLSKSFIDLLIINLVVPLKFCHAKKLGKDINEELLQLMTNLKPERNKIIQTYDRFGPKTDNALHSQAKLQLYKNYCTKNQCLKCAIGVALLNGNS